MQQELLIQHSPEVDELLFHIFIFNVRVRKYIFNVTFHDELQQGRIDLMRVRSSKLRVDDKIGRGSLQHAT